MKLRDRLFLFSTAQLVVFGAIFGVAYAAFEQTVPPMFAELLNGKNQRVTRLLSTELDVALGADDSTLMAKAIEYVERDPDFRYVVVRDAHDKVVISRGDRPGADVFAAFPYIAVDGRDGIRTWAPSASKECSSARSPWCSAPLDSTSSIPG